MAEARDLTLAFLESHSVESARVLESLPTDDAAAFLASVQERVAARVLAAMLPPAAARVLSALDPTAASALLNRASTPAAVAMLRHIPDPARARLIAHLPPASALASQVLLGFPDDTVGAWTDPEVTSLLPNLTAAAALERIRQDRDSDLGHIYVINTGRRLSGQVTLRHLLRAPDSALLQHLVQPVAGKLPVMMPLVAARGLPVWDRVVALPVVDHNDRLIGALRLATLTRALRSRRGAARDAPGGGSVTGGLASGYWTVVAALSGATLSLLPAVKRVLPEE